MEKSKVLLFALLQKVGIFIIQNGYLYIIYIKKLVQNTKIIIGVEISQNKEILIGYICKKEQKIDSKN
jgi:hypothetical protein